MRKIQKKISGSALLEFVLVLPILMTILAGGVELSILYFDKSIITNASREGARYGVAYQSPSYPSEAQITSYVQNYTNNKLITFGGAANVTVSATPSVSPPVFGATLTVTVNYTYTDLILHNFIGHGQQYNLTATTVMTYE